MHKKQVEEGFTTGFDSGENENFHYDVNEDDE